MAKQSRLEQEAFDWRENAVKNDYQRDINEYSGDHPDALSDGDEKGKGSGDGGMTYLIPDATKSKTQIKPTVTTDRGGSSVDIKQRETLQNINIYNKENAYGVDSIDTTANILAGQVVIK